MSVIKRLFLIIAFIILIIAAFNLYYEWSSVETVSGGTRGSGPPAGTGSGTASSSNPEGFSAPSLAVQPPVYSFDDAVSAPMPKQTRKVDPFEAKFNRIREIAIENGVAIYNTKRQSGNRVILYCRAPSRQEINDFMDALYTKGLISDIKEGGFMFQNYQGKRTAFCDLTIEMR